MDPEIRTIIQKGGVIPAHPLALNEKRKLDERRQRALTRYYVDSGAAGIAVAVHSTQFAIRDEKVGLFAPVLELAAESVRSWTKRPVVLIAGICGDTEQAGKEAGIACELGYHAGLLALRRQSGKSIDELIHHAEQVASVLPLMGFYLQEAVGGIPLSYRFWRRFLEIPNVVAVKVAPFNRYRTLDVARALFDSGREDVALYTGNDDNIIADLITPFVFGSEEKNQSAQQKPLRFAGGLLGQWAVWTRKACEILSAAKKAVENRSISASLLALSAALTDANAAIFDAAHNFAGCIPGIHEVLRRQGLLEGCWCLDPDEILSGGQRDEIDRVCRMYPELQDDAFVREHLATWLA